MQQFYNITSCLIGFLLLIFIKSTSIAQCPIIIFTEFQWELDGFAAGYPECKDFPGSITLWGDITDLSGLANLESIAGSFQIANADGILSLAGLDNLRSAKSIRLDKTPNLSDISSLANLEELNGLSITETAIGSIPQFNKLVSDSLDFYVGQNPNLGEIKLPSYLKGDRVRIFNNPSLTSISEPNVMTNIRSFHISNNENLTSISGFSQLESTTELQIRYNAKITNLPSFPNLTKVNEINGFYGDFEINSNASLTNINGFEKLEEVTNFVIEENSLEGISGFDQLSNVKNNFIINNEPSLIYIPSFLQLKKAHYFEIVATNLSSIIGFSSLETVTNTLSIRNNNQLSIIDGFQNLKHATLLNLSSNPMLSDCNAFCKYREWKGEEFSGYIAQNAPGCNSVEEFENDCVDTIADIIVYDVVLNVFNGAHSLERLENLTLEIHKDDQLLKTYVSDENGFIGLDLNELEAESEYNLVSYLGDDTNTKLIYNDITYEELSEDFFEIEFPHRLLDSLDAYQKSLDNRMITANYFGGALPINYNSTAYNLEGIDQVRIFWSEISEDHKDEVEKIKRLAYGLYMMNLYLDDAIRLTELTAKAGIETLYNAYKLLKELNGLQSVVNKFKEQYGELAYKQAMDKSMLAQRKMVYYITKKMFLNPYLASYENDPDSKQFVAAFKLTLSAIEDKIFDSNALTENIFQEIVYLAAAQKLLEAYYIPNSNSNLTTIEVDHSTIDKNFQDLVQESKKIRMDSEVDNINFEANADFYSGYGMDINELAGYIENLGLTVALVSGGTLTPMAVVIHEFAQGLKLGTLALNGVNFFSYGYRLAALSDELDQITNNYLLSPNYESASYADALLDQLTMNLEVDVEKAKTDLLDWKVLLQENNFTAFSESYNSISRFLEEEFAFSLNNIYAVIQNMGSELNASGIPDESFISIMEEYRKLEMQRYMMDIEMMALLFDLESEEIKIDFLEEIGTLTMYLDQISEKVVAFIEEHKTGEFPPLIVVSDYTYPDTFSLEPFQSTITISNLGPKITEAFNVLLQANENCSINLLESQTEDLVLQSGESIELEIEITPNQNNTQSSVFVEFENVRGINESLVFNFLEQQLFGDLSSSINTIWNESKETLIAPNPVQDYFLLKDGERKIGNVYSIKDINGNTIQNGKIKMEKINVSSLPSGIYFFNYQTKSNMRIVKFVKI